MRSGGYQDSVVAPLSREHDNDATDDNDVDDIMTDADNDVADGVLSAIEKVEIDITIFMTFELKLNMISFGRLSRQSVQALNVVNRGLAKSSSCSWKEARRQRILVPPLC